MTIERAYVEQAGLAPWEPIELEEFLRRTEWAGYWKKGTALEALRAAGEIRTPFALYRLKQGAAA